MQPATEANLVITGAVQLSGRLVAQDSVLVIINILQPTQSAVLLNIQNSIYTALVVVLVSMSRLGLENQVMNPCLLLVCVYSVHFPG